MSPAIITLTVFIYPKETRPRELRRMMLRGSCTLRPVPLPAACWRWAPGVRHQQVALYDIRPLTAAVTVCYVTAYRQRRRERT